MSKKTAALLISCMLLASCGGGERFRPGPGIVQVESGVLPLPNRADLTSQDRPYYIGPFDELLIDIFGIEALSKKEIQVDASGRLSFPLVGTIEAGGKTPGELAELLRTALKGRYLRDPQVTVNLKRTVSQVVTVEGEVKEPGLYPVVGKMSLMRAVATAKGTTEFSSLDDVVVFRTVGGRSYAALYNLRSIRNGIYPDPEIFANDVIAVGESRGRRLFRDLLQILPLATTPLVLALN